MPATKVPFYCEHSASGQAYVTLRGLDGRKRVVYLDFYDSPESHEKYRAVIAEWLTSAQRTPANRHAITDRGATIGEVMERFLIWTDGYYRGPDGGPTKEPSLIRLSLRHLKRLFGA